MRYVVEVERDEDGRWLAEVLDMPGAVAFGETRDEALRAAEALVLRTIADRVEHREVRPDKLEISFVSA
jgi:predicted RNase H-like HicB family nuclease